MKWLDGKKTYIVSGLTFLISLVEYLSVGNFSFESIINFFQSNDMAMLAATIRHAISKKT